MGAVCIAAPAPEAALPPVWPVHLWDDRLRKVEQPSPACGHQIPWARPQWIIFEALSEAWGLWGPSRTHPGSVGASPGAMSSARALGAEQPTWSHFNILPWFGQGKRPQRIWQICHWSTGQQVCCWRSEREPLALGEEGGYQQKAGGSASSFFSLSRTSLAQTPSLASRVEGSHHLAAVRRLLCSLGNEIRHGVSGFVFLWAAHPLHLPPGTAQPLTRAGPRGAGPCTERQCSVWGCWGISPRQGKPRVRVPNRSCVCSEPEVILCLCAEGMENARQMQRHLHLHSIQIPGMADEAGVHTGNMLCRSLCLLKMLLFFFPKKVTNNFRLNKYLERNILLNFLRFPWLEKNPTNSLLERIHLTFDKTLLHSLLLVLNRRSEEKHKGANYFLR